MTVSRIVAVILVIAAIVWIGSGVIGKADRKVDLAATVATEKPATRFKVSVAPAKVEPHARMVVLSGRTEAEKRASAIARAAGTIVDLRVRRGSVVKAGDVIAVLSDEARNAGVDQALARLEQRKIELQARLKLIEQGVYPAINKSQLEAELSGAEAGVQQARAERSKGTIAAPIAGIVNAVPVETGQAVQPGTVLAEVIALDPMLAVIELSERQLGGVRVGDRAQVKLITGQQAEGTVRFISPTASPQTRTYRVDIVLRNPAGEIQDGVTSEVSLQTASVAAARVPRSALTFSTEGRLSLRVVDSESRVASTQVAIIEDMLDIAWVTGIADGAMVIIMGQDFVKDGELVEAVSAVTAAR